MAEELRRHFFITSHEAHQSIENDLDHADAGRLVQILLKSDVPVLIVIEDPDESSKSFLRDFCRQLENHQSTPRNHKFHIYITSRNIRNIFSPEEIHKITIYQTAVLKGFSEKESIALLNEDPNQNSEEVNSSIKSQKACVKIYERFSGMPLGLKAAKGYCKKSRIDYEDYLQLIDENEMEVKDKESAINDFQEYGESASHVFQAIVMPFKPSIDSNANTSLRWKILSCLSYFHHDCVPRFLLERCCYVLLDDPKLKTKAQVKACAGQLISDLDEFGMCINSDINEISIHQVILNAFRCQHHADAAAKSIIMKKCVEILCSLVSKDFRKKENIER